MPEPLDYRNPKTGDPRQAIPEPAEPPRSDVAVPAEFDTLLTRSEDHGAVQAVEAALRREKIELFRRETGGRFVGRIGELHIRAADFERASQIAGEVFARRKKLQSFPRERQFVSREGDPGGRTPSV